MPNGQVLTVDRNLTIDAGTLSFDPVGTSQDVIDVNGSVFITNGSTAGSTTSNSVIRCQGHWRAEFPFVMANGRVELDSPATQTILGGPTTFPDLRIAGTAIADTDFTVLGALEVEAGGTLQLGAHELDVFGDWTSDGAGATVTGTEWIELRGTGQMRTGSNVIPPLRVAGGAVLFARTSKVQDLDLLGEIEVQGLQTFQVLGDLTGAGVMGFANTQSLQVLDVDGNVTLGPAASTGSTNDRSRIRCAGDWLTTNFFMSSGRVEFDGGTTASIQLQAGTELPDLRIVDGIKNLSSDGLIAGNLSVDQAPSSR